MKTKLERIEDGKVVLEIEVETAAIEQAIDKAYRNIARRVNIPGFRKGKAPRPLVEARIGGKAALLENAVEEVLPEAYAKAVEETEVKPVDRPAVEIVKAELEQPLVFKATVTVEPEPELGVYKGIEAEATEVSVTDDDVQKSLAMLRERFAKLEAVEDRPVQDGDYTVIDFTGYIDDKPFHGGEAKDFNLQIGSGAFIPGFEEQLIGAAKDETKKITVTFPEDYHSKELAGKPATFEVTVREIKQQILPELDDEFAKTASRFDSLEELKNDIENKLKQAADDNAKRRLENAVVSQAVDNAAVEIPAAMIERRLERMIAELTSDLEKQGATLEQYLEYSKKTLEELRQDFKPGVEREIKTDLVLAKVARVENLTAAPEEVDAEVERVAKTYGQDPLLVKQRFAEQGSLAVVEEGLVLRKAVDFLVANAAVKQTD